MWSLNTIWSSSEFWRPLHLMCFTTSFYLQILCWWHFQRPWLTFIFPTASLFAFSYMSNSRSSKSHRRKKGRRVGKKCNYNFLNDNVQIYHLTFFLKAFSLNEYIWPDNCIKILVIFSVVMVACGMTSLLQKSAELLLLSRLGSIMCFSFACAALHQLVKTNRLNEKSSHPATKGVNSLRGFQSLITHCKSLSRQLLNAI